MKPSVLYFLNASILLVKYILTFLTVRLIYQSVMYKIWVQAEIKGKKWFMHVVPFYIAPTPPPFAIKMNRIFFQFKILPHF